MHLGSHILVPLDGSPLAQEALPLGLALGRRHGWAVELVYVHGPPPMPASAPHVDPRFDREQRDEMQRWLSALTEAVVREHGQAVTATFLEGAVARTLEDHVARRAPGLVVMATHGRGGPEPGRVVGAADAAFRRVMVPLDGSKLAEQAVEPVLALGARGDVEYTLLTVVEPPRLSTPSVMMVVVASETASDAETLAQIAALRQAVAEQYPGI